MSENSPSSPSEILTQVLRMSWLWTIFAGFYLVAYAFWVPGLFGSLTLVILVVALTLALGGTLLMDGFAIALGLQSNQQLEPIPYRRARRLLGGIVLLGYVDVYLPPDGRIVAHWPLDLAITVLSGLIMVYYAVKGTRTPSNESPATSSVAGGEL